MSSCVCILAGARDARVSLNRVWNFVLGGSNGVQCRWHDAIRSKGVQEQF